VEYVLDQAKQYAINALVVVKFRVIIPAVLMAVLIVTYVMEKVVLHIRLHIKLHIQNTIMALIIHGIELNIVLNINFAVSVHTAKLVVLNVLEQKKLIVRFVMLLDDCLAINVLALE
jgi:hypothetical protein